MSFEDMEGKVRELYALMHRAEAEYIGLWLRNQLLTWRWWMALLVTIAPWTLWLAVRNRESTYRMLTVYFFVALFAVMADFTGVHLGLWYYPVSLLPLMPCYTPFNLSALPVTTMLFLQFRPKAKPACKALVYASLGSFVFQPAMEAIGLVVHEHWSSVASFPVLFTLYMTSHFLATRAQYDPVI
jgi:uncharacterized membrane protein YoaT (DUF817 family)